MYPDISGYAYIRHRSDDIYCMTNQAVASAKMPDSNASLISLKL